MNAAPPPVVVANVDGCQCQGEQPARMTLAPEVEGTDIARQRLSDISLLVGAIGALLYVHQMLRGK